MNIGDKVREFVGLLEKRPYGNIGIVKEVNARTIVVEFSDKKGKLYTKKMSKSNPNCDECADDYEVQTYENATILYNICSKLRKLTDDPFVLTDQTLGDDSLGSEVRMASELLKRIEKIANKAKEL